MMTEYDRISRLLKDSYRSRTEKSRSLHMEAMKVMPGGDTRNVTFFRPYPTYMSHGNGARLWDADGNEILDFQNNYTSLIHGHAHPATVAAVREQIALGSAYSAPMKKQIELAEIICGRVASVDKVRFTNSGTEATMHAVRGARAFTGRTRIVKIEGGYHGSSDTFEASVEPDMKDVGELSRPKAVADSRGVPQCIIDQVIVVPLNDIEITRKLLEESHRDIAAFIIEPVLGSAGQLAVSKEYLEAIRELTAAYGIVLIFDEIVTFRLSTGGLQKIYGIQPDMTTFGKIIGGGIPIGAFGGKDEIMSMYDPTLKLMSHSGTFNGNAVSMAAGIATLESYGEKEAAYVNHLGELFREGVKSVFDETGLDLWINGVGSLSNLIFSNSRITEYRGVARSHEEFNVLMGLALLNRGVFMAPRGMFCTSTAMSEEDVLRGVAAVKESLLEILPAIEEGAPELLTHSSLL